MKGLAAGSVRAWTVRNRARLLLSLRIVVASVLTFALAHLLGLPQSYWAVLTAVIVMQASVGGALKATTDRLIGSLGGAVWGVIVCLTLPHAGAMALGIALVVAVAPLAVVTAFKPAYRIAPVTAIILLLTPTSLAVGPVTAALHRLMEVGLGSLVAVAVALLLVPARARTALTRAADSALAMMADLIVILMAGLTQARDPAAVAGLHERIRKAIAEAESAAGEARRERVISLTGAPDPAPLCRTLRRLHHDLTAVGRASVTPLPASVQEPVAAPAAEVAAAVAAFLRASGAELIRQAPAPSAAAAEQALGRFSAAVVHLRAGGLTRALPDEALARLFGLAFVLEQLGQDLNDLVDRVRELASSAGGSGDAP